MRHTFILKNKTSKGRQPLWFPHNTDGVSGDTWVMHNGEQHCTTQSKPSILTKGTNTTFLSRILAGTNTNKSIRQHLSFDCDIWIWMLAYGKCLKLQTTQSSHFRLCRFPLTKASRRLEWSFLRYRMLRLCLCVKKKPYRTTRSTENVPPKLTGQDVDLQLGSSCFRCSTACLPYPILPSSSWLNDTGRCREIRRTSRC